MLFVNRDAVGVPDLGHDLARAVREAFDGAEVVPIVDDRGFQVRPRQSSGFSVYVHDSMRSGRRLRPRATR